MSTGESRPMVSIVMPAFNVEDYIEEAIISITGQTYKNFELIIIDDGSTDSTARIIQEISANDSQITVITQANSGKPSIARNAGLRIAKGLLITFLDADDKYCSNRLERVVSVFSQHPEISVAFHDMNVITDDEASGTDRYLQKSEFLKRADSYLDKCDDIYLGKSNFYNFVSAYDSSASTSSIAFRSSLLSEESKYFPEDMTIGEDIDLWFRLMSRGRTAYIDEALSFYRHRQGSISDNQEMLFLGFIDAHSANLERCRKRLSREELKHYKKRLADECSYLAYYYRQDRQLKISIEYYWQAFKTYKSTKYLNGLIKALIVMLGKP